MDQRLTGQWYKEEMGETLNKDGVDGCAETSRYIEPIPSGYPTENFPASKKAGFVYNDAEFWRI